jgi:hypothetical protein
MPRRMCAAVELAKCQVRRSRGPDAPTSSAVDSEPRDWSELGRRVLAEALRRATDELKRRNAALPASVVPPPAREGQS